MKILSLLILIVSLATGGSIWQSGEVRAQTEVVAPSLDLPAVPMATVEPDMQPEPAAVPERVMTPEGIQAEFLKWMGFATVAAGSLAAFVTYVLGKVHEVKRVVTQLQATQVTQDLKIHQTAVATVPAVMPVPESIAKDVDAAKIAAVVLLCLLGMSGCAGARVSRLGAGYTPGGEATGYIELQYAGK